MTEIREIALKIFLAARMAAGFDFGARFRITIYIPEPRSGWGKWGWEVIGDVVLVACVAPGWLGGFPG